MIRLVSIVILGTFCGSTAFADDWPTHLHDNQRSGVSTETLKLPLQLRWTTKLPKPEPAWPPPARQDYWHRKTDLSPRIVHDRANPMVVAHGKLVVGSSADDQVRAFDTLTGELLWTVFAEAPIRLAPTIWQQLVVFGSDDGIVYGVDLGSGKLRWKTRAPEVGLRRIPGNGRIISERPIRSGVMVNEEGTGFFAAGIFPKQGAYFYSMDVRNGKILDQSRIEKSIQGYLEQRHNGIFAATGRDPSGTALVGKLNANQSKLLPTEGTRTYSRIADAVHEYLGQQDQIVARRVGGSGEHVWKASIDGKVYDLAIAKGQLFASSDSGRLYAFGDTHAAIPQVRQGQAIGEDAQPATNIRAYSLFVDPQPGEDVAKLLDWTRRGDRKIVVAVHSDDAAAAIREQLKQATASHKVAVHIHASMDSLPYAAGIFTRIVGGKCASVQCLLSPFHGIAECDDGRLSNLDPSDLSAWSHAYGNAGNTASNQARLGSQPLRLQWFGGPGPRNLVDRHMRTMPPLSNGGILYLPGLDQVIALDAFTGLVRWETEIPNSTRIGMLKDCGWMVAKERSLLVAVGNKLLEYTADADAKNATSSKVIHKVPFDHRDWGFLASMGSQVIGSSVIPNSSRRSINREAILEGAYSDDRPIVCSDGLFGIGGSDRWQYRSNGAILNPTIGVTQRFVICVENDQKNFEQSTGRIKLADFLRQDARLVAFDVQTGARVWDRKLEPIEGAQNAYVLCDEDHVALVTSRNAQTVHYDVRVFQIHDGRPLWNVTQDNRKKPGGDHGEQDKHPVMVGSRLIVEPYAYDVHTGKEIDGLNLKKRGYGCGTLSASSDALFFRSGNPARLSLETNKLDLVTSVTRPGCWINMIPASGMLLIPDGSSGCTCNYAVQTSMALIPAD